MREFIAFLKKEWQESIASYRLLILVIVFALFGLMNVFTAKYTPEIVGHLISEEMASTIPVPKLVDVWLQFFKNIGQVGIFVVVILFSGTLTNEYSKGTLTLLITKGLSRFKIILAKWLMNVLVFTLSYLLAVGLTFIYAQIYFDSMELNQLILGIFILWLFTVFLISLISLASVLFKTNYLVLLFVGGINVGLMLLNLIPKVKEYNPITLGTSSSSLLQGSLGDLDLTKGIVVTIGLIILMNLLAIKLFNKKSL